MIKLKIAICWVMLTLPSWAICQNLVVNPSFEEFTTCPGINDGVYYLPGWHELTSEGSLNVLTTCAGTSPSTYFGSQSPKTGNSYLHLSSCGFRYPRDFDHSGYIFKEAPLGTFSEQLTVGRHYFSVYIVVADKREAGLSNSFLTSAMDLILFDTIPGHPFHAEPPYLDTAKIVWANPEINIISDSIKWIKIGGCFDAKGGEKYFSFGTFRDTSKILLFPNLVYNLDWLCYTSFFVDDIQIVKCPDCSCVETLPDPEPDPKTNLTISNNPGLPGQPVTFQMGLGAEKTWHLKLYDYAGRLVYDHLEKSATIIHAPPESLAKAMYQFVLEVTGMETIYGKVITGN